ncbi:MAG: PH domain-containing protein [Pseudomonadota bacterium]|nr:PH domain-containing protein [Pseudomonadota bacterium]
MTAIGLIFLTWRLFVYLTTELALTNKRVIARYGVISRNVIDVSISKVEGVTFTQGLIGRIFNYGALFVRGTGAGNVPIKFISQPEIFRDQINQELHR